MFFDTLLAIFGVPFLGGAILDAKHTKWQIEEERKWISENRGKWKDVISDYEIEREIKNLCLCKKEEAAKLVEEILEPEELSYGLQSKYFLKNYEAYKVNMFVIMAKRGKLPYWEWLNPFDATCYEKETAIFLYKICQWAFEVELPRHGLIAPGFMVYIKEPNYGEYKVVGLDAVPPSSPALQEYLKAKHKGRINADFKS